MRILIVDDERPTRERLRRMLALEPDIEAIEEAADGVEALMLVVLTSTLSFGLFELLRRVRLLRPLFGLAPRTAVRGAVHGAVEGAAPAATHGTSAGAREQAFG